MATLLPLDDNSHPIGILAFCPNGTQKLAVGTTSVRSTALPQNVRVVTLFATGPCRFEVGGASVVASAADSPFIAAGYYLDLPLDKDERHVAFIAESGSCSAYVIGRT